MSYRSELIQVAAVALAALQVEDLGSTKLDYIGRKKLDDLLQEVFAERDRQEDKWGEQKHGPAMWAIILAEEFGEAVEEIKEAPGMHIDRVLRSITQNGDAARAILEAR